MLCGIATRGIDAFCFLRMIIGYPTPFVITQERFFLFWSDCVFSAPDPQVPACFSALQKSQHTPFSLSRGVKVGEGLLAINVEIFRCNGYQRTHGLRQIAQETPKTTRYRIQTKKCDWGGDISHVKSMYYVEILRYTESLIPCHWIGTWVCFIRICYYFLIMGGFAIDQLIFRGIATSPTHWWFIA